MYIYVSACFIYIPHCTHYSNWLFILGQYTYICVLYTSLVLGSTCYTHPHTHVHLAPNNLSYTHLCIVHLSEQYIYHCIYPCILANPPSPPPPKNALNKRRHQPTVTNIENIDNRLDRSRKHYRCNVYLGKV